MILETLFWAICLAPGLIPAYVFLFSKRYNSSTDSEFNYDSLVEATRPTFQDLAEVAGELTAKAEAIGSKSMDYDPLIETADKLVRLDCSDPKERDEFALFVADNDTVTKEMILGALDTNPRLFDTLYPNWEEGDALTVIAINRADQARAAL